MRYSIIFGGQMKATIQELTSVSTQTGKTYLSVTVDAGGAPIKGSVWPNNPAHGELAKHKVGDEVEITFQAQGKYTNVVTVGGIGQAPRPSFAAKAAAPIAKKEWTPQKSGYDNDGQQIGNAITNASTIVAAMIKSDKLKSTTEASLNKIMEPLVTYLLGLGVRARGELERIKKGTINEVVAQQINEAQHRGNEDDGDIVEGDDHPF